MRETNKMTRLGANSGTIRAALMTLVLAAAATCQAATKGPDAGGYSATDATVYSFIDISGPGGGTSTLAGTDDSTAALTLPFAFQFYGTSYTLVCASSNGALYFVPDSPTCASIANDFANTDLTVAGPPGDAPAVLPFWTDLTFQVPGAGAVYYQSFGAVGSRRFVVQWSNAYPQGTSNPVTFEVILTEGTNAIMFQYQTVTLGGGNPASNGALSTVGIRNAGSVSNNQQIEWSYDAAVLSNSYALLFQPGGAPPAPVLVSPANGAAGVSTPVTLSWNAAAGATSYDVYFGTTSPPSLATNTTSTSYNPPGVALSTSYNWQVVAKNGLGSSGSAVSSFTTASQICTYALDSSSASFPTTGGSGSFNVIAPAGCAWSVSGVPPWITITAGASGSGNGPVSYTVSSNSGGGQGASLTVGGQSYLVSEAGIVSTPPTKLTPTISWSTPSPIVYGTPLGTTQLNATANVGGTFVYTPPAGTILSVGSQTLSVAFTPYATNYNAGTATVTLVVNPVPPVSPASQTISFSAIPNHLSSDAPFTLTATATSGLPVVFSIVSGPATLSGNTLTITGPGTVSVQASQAGNSSFAAATPVLQTFTVGLGTISIGSILNAASYATAPLATDAYAVIFGTDFSLQTALAPTLPLPTQLAGLTLTVTDSTGATKSALLYYVSPTQIDFVVPEGLAGGAGTVSISNVNGKTGSFAVTLGSIAPALFSADASGKGAVAALAIAFGPDNSVQPVPVFSCSGTPVVCTTVPIDLSAAGTSVYLELFGTGIRGLSGIAGITVTAGGKALQVTYAGAQPVYPGLDQVNVLLYPSLTGSGVVTLQMTVDGIAANPVQINIK